MNYPIVCTHRMTSNQQPLPKLHACLPVDCVSLAMGSGASSVKFVTHCLLRWANQNDFIQGESERVVAGAVLAKDLTNFCVFLTLHIHLFANL